MRPCERDSDDGHGQNHRRNEMPEREPPARKHQPDQIADQAEQTGADIGLAGQAIAAHGPLAERQQRVDGDIEGGPRPGQADDGDRHDDRGDDPATAIQTPPSSSHRIFRNIETGCMWPLRVKTR